MSYQSFLALFIGAQPEEGARLIHSASRTVLIVCSLLFSIFGIPGNILAIKILQRRLMRDNVLSVYLIWLATMNICCLVIEMNRFFLIGLLDFNYREVSYEVCLIHRWATVMVITVCNWFLVFIALARWLLLRYPARTATLFKQTNVHIFIIVVIFSIGFIQGFGLLHWFGFDFTGSQAARNYFKRTLCRLHAASLAYIVIRLFIGVVPLVFLAFLSFLIFYQVKAGSRRTTVNLPLATLNRRAVRERNLAVLLLISNIQFMITNLPLAIYYLTAHKFFNESSKLDRALSELAGNVARMSLYGGYATNCIIFCFFGSRFRSELIKFLYENGICRKHLRRGSEFPIYGTQTTRSVFTLAIEASQKPQSTETAVSRLPELERADQESFGHQTSCVHSDVRASCSAQRSTCIDSLKA